MFKRLIPLLFALAAVPVFGAVIFVGTDPAPSPGNITPSISASRIECASPCSVHFDATGTTRTGWSHEEAMVKLRYEWEFGDIAYSSGSGDTTRGSFAYAGLNQSLNEMEGYVAAHTFEGEGLRTVTLYVADHTTDETTIETILIDVTGEDAAWPGSSTICVSSSGDFSNCPNADSNYHITNSDFSEIIQNSPSPTNGGCNIDDAAVRCLLRGDGDSYTYSSGGFGFGFNAITGDDDGISAPRLLGAYDDSVTLPQVDFTGTNDALGLEDSADDVRIQNIAFDGNLTEAWGIWAPTTGTASIRHITLDGVDVRGFDSQVHFRQANASPAHYYIVISNSMIHRGTGMGGVDIYYGCDSCAVINTLSGDRLESPDTSRGGEHNFRGGWTNKLVMAYNNFGRHDLVDPTVDGCARDSGGGGNTSVTLRSKSGTSSDWSWYYNVQGNQIHACRTAGFMFNFDVTGSGASRVGEHHKIGLFERNHLWAGSAVKGYPATQLPGGATGTVLMLKISNSEWLMVRNNTFDMTGWDDTTHGIQFRLYAEHQNAVGHVDEGNHFIYNNSFLQNEATTESRSFILFTGDGSGTRFYPTAAGPVNIDGNLAYDVDNDATLVGTSSSFAGTHPLCCGSDCEVTSGSCNRHPASDPYTIVGDVGINDYDQDAASDGIDNGECQDAVRTDYLGNCRPSTNCDAGVHEFGATGECTPVTNSAPVVITGGPYAITLPTSTASLSAAGTFDPDGDPMTYFWECLNVTGTPCTGIGWTGRTTDTAEINTITNDGTAQITLTVDDDQGNQTVANTTLTVNPVPVGTTTCYWVGGAGDWDDTAMWKSTSGGAGACAAVTPTGYPDDDDNAIFDTNSGTGIVSLNGNQSALDLTFDAAVGAIVFNIAGNTLTVAGDLIAEDGSSATTTTTRGTGTVKVGGDFDQKGWVSLNENQGDYENLTLLFTGDGELRYLADGVGDRLPGFYKFGCEGSNVDITLRPEGAVYPGRDVVVRTSITAGTSGCSIQSTRVDASGGNPITIEIHHYDDLNFDGAMTYNAEKLEHEFQGCGSACQLNGDVTFGSNVATVDMTGINTSQATWTVVNSNIDFNAANIFMEKGMILDAGAFNVTTTGTISDGTSSGASAGYQFSASSGTHSFGGIIQDDSGSPGRIGTLNLETSETTSTSFYVGDNSNTDIITGASGGHLHLTDATPACSGTVIRVATGGVDDGSCGGVGDECGTLDQAVNVRNGLDGANDCVQLNKGDTFPAPSTLDAGATGGGNIGAFGTGADPIVTKSAGTTISLDGEFTWVESELQFIP